MAYRKVTADWERIETDYRIGLRSLREIATEHGIAEGTLRMRAQRQGWDRNLGAKVAARTEALVAKKQARLEGGLPPLINEKALVQATAEATANVAVRHREDLRAARDSAIGMLRELLATNGETLREVLDVLQREAPNDPDEHSAYVQRLALSLDRAGSLPGRTTNLQRIADVLVKVVDAERKAWKLDAESGTGDGVPFVIMRDFTGRVRKPPPLEVLPEVQPEVQPDTPLAVVHDFTEARQA